MTEQFANNATTTITGAMLSTDTLLTVASASLFPSSPQFRIMIDAEIMLVTALSGAGNTTFTVARAAEGTIATAHSLGATVEHILTAGAIQQLKTDVTTSNVTLNTFVNRPAFPTAGQMFLPTDGGYQQVYDGTQWRPIVDNVLCTEPPAASTFGLQLNWSTTTLTKTNGSLYISAPAPAATGTIRAAVTSIPTPSACQIQTLVTVQNNAIPATIATNEFPGAGVAMYESASGKFATINIAQGVSLASGQQDWLIVSQSIWTNTTTRSSFTDFIQHGTIPFLRLRITSATLFWEISADLQTWQTLNSVAANTVFTTNGIPSHYGVISSHFTNGTVPAVLAQFNHILLG